MLCLNIIRFTNSKVFFFFLKWNSKVFSACDLGTKASTQHCLELIDWKTFKY